MQVLTVSPGTTITFFNADQTTHTLASGNPTDGLTGTFDSGLLMTGESYEFVIHEEDTYDYFCIVHPWMTGQIVVVTEEEADANPILPSPEAPSGTADIAALKDRIRVLEARVAALEALVERLSGVQTYAPQPAFNATAMIHEALVYKFIEELNNPTPSNSTAP